MMPSSVNNPALGAKVLKRASHTNKLLLVASLFLICVIVVGGVTGLYFTRKNGYSVQVPPITRETGRGASNGQPRQDGTAGGKLTDHRPTSAAQGATTNPYTPSMDTLIVNDSLTSNHLGWDEGDPCKIDRGGYYIGVPAQQSAICYAHATNYANFTYEVQMSFLKVNDADPDAVVTGLVFRGDNDTGASFRIEVHLNGRFVPFMCKAADDCTNLDTTDQARSANAQQAATTFNGGLEQVNKLAVVADNNLVVFYINGQEVFSTKQAGFPRHGMIGVYLRSGSKDTAAVALFSNLRVWQAS